MSEVVLKEKLLYTGEEARRLLGIGHSKMWELLMMGEIPSIKVGKCRRIPADALREWVDRQLAEQSAA